MGQVARGATCLHAATLVLLVVAHDARVPPAGSDELGTRQRGEIDDHVRSEVLAGMGHAVAEHQSTLCVCVVHFHGLARVHRKDVVRAHRVGTHGVLGEAQQGVEPVLVAKVDGR